MPRSMNNPASRERRRKVLKKAKGYWGGRKNLYRMAHTTLMKAMSYATRDRRVRKRDFRQLWTARINAGCHGVGVSYSRFIAALKKANVELDRKSLAEIAVRDGDAFKQIVDLVMGTAGRKAVKA